MKIGPLLKNATRFMSKTHIFLYRLSGGAIGGKAMGLPVLLLTTSGRKTGNQYTVPLFCLEENGTYYVVASFMGSDQDPIWWRNLQKTPQAHVQMRGRKVKVTASQADPETKARMWPKFAEKYKLYDNYQKSTQRDIPIVVLKPEA